jgi:hypothetical protein
MCCWHCLPFFVVRSSVCTLICRQLSGMVCCIALVVCLPHVGSAVALLCDVRMQYTALPFPGVTFCQACVKCTCVCNMCVWAVVGSVVSLAKIFL